MGFWAFLVHQLPGRRGAAALRQWLPHVSWRALYWGAIVLLLLLYAWLLVTEPTGVGRGGR
jgi:hypothetical protein